jgi:hypothetical protein
MKCVISQVLVRRCRIAVHLVERNRDFLLTDSHLYDNHEVGLFFDRCNLHQIIVHGCHISWNKVAGIKSLGGDVHNLQIVGNDIEYNNRTAGGQPKTPAADGHPGGSEIWFDATDGVISEVTISGNTIQATVQAGGANIRIVGAEVQRPQTADAPQDPKGRYRAPHQHHRQRARQSVASGRTPQRLASHDDRQHDLRLGRFIRVRREMCGHRRQRQRLRLARQ